MNQSNRRGWFSRLRFHTAAHRPTVRRLAAISAGSPEYVQLRGGTNDGFLTGIFVDQLGRPTTLNGIPVDPVDLNHPGGRAGWDRVFASGVNPFTAATLILSSRENLGNQ